MTNAAFDAVNANAGDCWERRPLPIRETVRQVRCVSWTASITKERNLSMFIFNVQESPWTGRSQPMQKGMNI